MDFGDFDGRTADEMAEDPAYRAWVEQGCSTRCPNGETRAEFCSRSCRAFAALVEQTAAEGRESLVIVAHGGTLRAVMERFSEPQFAFFALPTPFGGGYVLEYEASLWQRERKLRLLRAVSREGESAAC
jgi:alpha-ribazole phosphatase